MHTFTLINVFIVLNISENTKDVEMINMSL